MVKSQRARSRFGSPLRSEYHRISDDIYPIKSFLTFNEVLQDKY